MKTRDGAVVPPTRIGRSVFRVVRGANSSAQVQRWKRRSGEWLNVDKPDPWKLLAEGADPLTIDEQAAVGIPDPTTPTPERLPPLVRISKLDAGHFIVHWFQGSRLFTAAWENADKPWRAGYTGNLRMVWKQGHQADSPAIGRIPDAEIRDWLEHLLPSLHADEHSPATIHNFVLPDLAPFSAGADTEPIASREGGQRASFDSSWRGPALSLFVCFSSFFFLSFLTPDGTRFWLPCALVPTYTTCGPTVHDFLVGVH